jgi:hypothetical protein
MSSSSSVNLIGRIEHVISTNTGVTENQDGKKRSRPWENSHDKSHNTSSHRGFVFVCTEPSQFLSSFGTIFQFVVPLSLIRVACHAAATGKIIQLSRFSLIRYQNGRGRVVFDSRYGLVDEKEEQYVPDEHNNHSSIMVAEVHKGGIAIMGDETDSTAIYNKQNLEGQVLTLEMLAAKEQSVSKKEKKSAKLPMNITAVVDAISPIFIHDTERPFALMELYQAENISYNAVVVLRGEQALSMHAAIQPGQSITLVGVVNRSWKVPDGFRQYAKSATDGDISRFYERLFQRTPDRVILVEDPNCIRFDNAQYDEILPSTVESLTSVRGVIQAVHYYQYEDARTNQAEDIVHYVTVRQFTQQHTQYDADDCESMCYDSDDNEVDSSSNSKLVQINLLKYSFSPQNTLGLQIGAIICAVNIHWISANTSEKIFVACLRSTITIERCASDGCDLIRPFFVSNSPDYNVVPNHRIARICSDPSRSVPSTRYFEEDRLKFKVQQMQLMNDSAILTRNIRFLLARHYKRGSYSYTSSNTKNPTIRDPYSEFFDHAQCDESRHGSECGSCARDNMSQFFCQCNASSESTPNIVRLDVLRDTCVEDFVNKVSKFSSAPGSLVSSGSTSSYHYYSSKVYVWGRINFSGQLKSGSSSVGVVHHGTSKIPFSVAMDGAETTRATKNVNSCDFDGWLQVKSVLVSCLCLGRVQLEEQSRSADEPTQSTRAWTKQHKFIATSSSATKLDHLSHNFVFIVEDRMFIGAVQIIGIPISYDDLYAGNGSKHDRMHGAHIKGNAIRMPSMNIQDCLERAFNDKDYSVSIIGRLIRQRFQFRKARRTQNYEGWTITLSHIDESHDSSLASSSFLQTIEVNVAIPVGRPSDLLWTSLKTTLRDLLLSRSNKSSESHHDPLHKVSTDQLTMGLAFLRASANRSTQTLLCGGFESCNNRLFVETANSSTMKSISIHVSIPTRSREISKLGYQRFKCRLEDIQSFALVETFVVPESPCPTHVLDFSVSPSKFLPGMLSRRLSRSKTHVTKKKCIGETNTQSHTVLSAMNGAVPRVSLADLHHYACRALSEKQPAHLYPSLLRRIYNAKILGISFCRARVECTQCFEILKSSNADDRSLVCPSGCSRMHAAIKWECSGVVDDGTGQAKLYAEREAALLLMGPTLDADSVEKGAWMNQNGIFFQPALPPSNYLQRCFKEASIEAKKHNTQLMKEDREAFRKSKPATANDFVTAQAKAEYLLQRHCRQWYEKHHHLKVDLFCRCKPLSTDATSVNRTEIEVAKAVDGCCLDFGTIQTSTLPPLKLILEDMCLANETNQNDSTTAWGMLAEFTSR